MTPSPRRPVTRRDLDSRSDIHDLVVAFYRAVVHDDVLAPVFDETAEVDWAEHIPRLIEYWCRVLLREPGSRERIVDAHARVHAIAPLRPEHFFRLFELWASVVDATWSGPTAQRAKDHAARIGSVIALHLVEIPPPSSPIGNDCSYPATELDRRASDPGRLASASIDARPGREKAM